MRVVFALGFLAVAQAWQAAHGISPRYTHRGRAARACAAVPELEALSGDAPLTSSTTETAEALMQRVLEWCASEPNP